MIGCICCLESYWHPRQSLCRHISSEVAKSQRDSLAPIVPREGVNMGVGPGRDGSDAAELPAGEGVLLLCRLALHTRHRPVLHFLPVLAYCTDRGSLFTVNLNSDKQLRP